ncbi:T9SS type B sorting domain-containing protein [Flavobacterium sp.]|jgi:gliding motility-associated-like protein|uniref:T9SS type B sorting domain-containing protein n=1 Tax=Flavobacterium sp. TaxID=239 RepID=UPI0037BE619A
MNFYKKIIYLFVSFFAQFSFSQNDCVDALVACGNSNYNNISIVGPGISEIDFTNSCTGQENNSLWIKVTIQNPGTLGFTLIPNNASLNIDFDFWVFGPTASCSNLGQTIRCSTTNPQLSNASNNQTGMNATETDTFEGPAAQGNNFVSALNVLANETYYLVIDRFSGDSNFSLQWTGTATFSDAPIINNTTAGSTLNISKCDSDAVQDNSTSFDLTQNQSLAIGLQTNILATFHISENDAIVGSNKIINTTNFTNTSNPQIIYIRLENALTGCFTTSNFSLTVTPFQTQNPINIESCDFDNNGFATFNLLENTFILTNGDPNLVVTYHPTNNDTTTLPNNYTNQVAFTNETLWAKISDSSTSCYAYKPFDIIINPAPVAVASQLTQCDFEVFPNGLTTFNLNEANNIITNNNANYVTSFYLNNADAVANINALSSNYTNISNPQIISVRVTNSVTGCFSITQLTLNVTVNPTQVVTIEKCDDDGTEDGITTFNLADAGFEQSGNTVTYFSTPNDALLELNQITTTTFTTQTVYARIENGNDCIGVNVINLIIKPLPNFTITQFGLLCLNDVSKSTQLTAQMVNPLSHSFLWTPTNETTQSIDVTQNGTYTVTVTNNTTSCTKTLDIIVTSSEIATIQDIEIVELSDNNSVEVLVNGNGDYVYSIQEPYGPYQDSNIFTNVPMGFHTIYVKDLNGCGISEQLISVLGVPQYFTPNGDGFNDTWNIKGVNEQFYANSIIHIYDRYGKLVKQISAIGQGWDGTYNGNLAPSDDYWYNITFDDGRNAKGHFALKR